MTQYSPSSVNPLIRKMCDNFESLSDDLEAVILSAGEVAFTYTKLLRSFRHPFYGKHQWHHCLKANTFIHTLTTPSTPNV